ncbi:hypothetical protein EC968_009966 [Mortierella alpina]|nr:hypothetical protein EC968_009966 [Mortierella alpina]
MPSKPVTNAKNSASLLIVEDGQRRQQSEAIPKATEDHENVANLAPLQCFTDNKNVHLPYEHIPQKESYHVAVAISSEDSSTGLVEGVPENDKKSRSKRGNYRTYTAEQIETLLWLVNEKLYSVNQAAKEAGIAPRTAHNMMERFRKTGAFPMKHATTGSRRSTVLNLPHIEALNSCLAENPIAAATDATDVLSDQFKGLVVSETTLGTASRSPITAVTSAIDTYTSDSDGGEDDFHN